MPRGVGLSFDQARAATMEAVRLYRTLAAGNPAHQPAFAQALDLLAKRSCQLGDHEDEFTRRREAPRVYRSMLERDADLYEPVYRRATADLQAAYVRHGRDEEAMRLGLSSP